MSTYYRPRRPLKLDDVRKLEEFDVVKDGKDWGFQSKDSFLSVETNSKGFVIDVFVMVVTMLMIYSLILNQNLESHSFQKKKLTTSTIVMKNQRCIC